MNSHLKLISLGIVALISLAANWFYHPVAQHIHLHAGFVVYVDGIKQDYSDYKYMDLESCSEEEVATNQADEQKEKAHLHDGVGDVVHVHRSGAKWSDLFKNIGVTFPKTKQIRGLVNGTEVKNIMQQPIREHESVVLVVGDDQTDHSQERISLEYIKGIEAKSESCGVN